MSIGFKLKRSEKKEKSKKKQVYETAPEMSYQDSSAHRTQHNEMMDQNMDYEKQRYANNRYSENTGNQKSLKDLQIRLVISALLFLLVFTLKQIPETENWLTTCGIMDKIESFDDIYRLEDECILWYNSLADEK